MSRYNLRSRTRNAQADQSAPANESLPPITEHSESEHDSEYAPSEYAQSEQSYSHSEQSYAQTERYSVEPQAHAEHAPAENCTKFEQYQQLPVGLYRDPANPGVLLSVENSATGQGQHIHFIDAPPLPQLQESTSSSTTSSSGGYDLRFQTPQRDVPYEPGSVIRTPVKRAPPLQRSPFRIGGGFPFWKDADGVEHKLIFVADPVNKKPAAPLPDPNAPNVLTPEELQKRQKWVADERAKQWAIDERTSREQYRKLLELNEIQKRAWQSAQDAENDNGMEVDEDASQASTTSRSSAEPQSQPASQQQQTQTSLLAPIREEASYNATTYVERPSTQPSFPNIYSDSGGAIRYHFDDGVWALEGDISHPNMIYFTQQFRAQKEEEARSRAQQGGGQAPAQMNAVAGPSSRPMNNPPPTSSPARRLRREAPIPRTRPAPPRLQPQPTEPDLESMRKAARGTQTALGRKATQYDFESIQKPAKGERYGR